MLQFARELSRAAAQHTLPLFRSPTLLVESKNTQNLAFNPVSSADKNAESAMRRLIQSQYPKHGILGEEFPPIPAQPQQPTWILDPIDGTKSFLVGSPLWQTLIGLLNPQGEPILGVTHQPYLQEQYEGALNPDGSRFAQLTTPKNTTPLLTRTCPNLQNAVFASTSPHLFQAPQQQQLLQYLSSKSKFTRYGGDSYFYVMLAAGLIDVVAEPNLQPYDILPLIPIIRGAGGVVTSWDGKPLTHGGNVLASGDPKLHQHILSFIASLS